MQAMPMELVVGIVAVVVALVVYNAMVSARAWPLLRRRAPVCRTLAGLADEYGPFFTLRIGFRRTHVVSSWEALKECFTTNDKFLASRPASALGKYIGQNYAIFGLGPDGPYWQHMRKLVTVELLSSAKLSELSHVRVSEVAAFMKDLHALSDKRILLNDWFCRLVMNVISRMVATKRYAYYSTTPEDEEALKAQRTIKDLMYAAGQFVISDAIPFPFLERLDPQGHIKMMKRVSKDIDLLTGGWVEEHRQQRLSLQHHQPCHRDFIDIMLSSVDQGEIKSDHHHTADTKVKALVKAMFLGATDSTSVTLTWLVSLLLNHPRVLGRAMEELDRVVGRDRWVADSDINDLVYLQAIVKETLRLYPAAPLLVPHTATGDCRVAGHRIERGDQLLVNVWKVHRDPRVWKGDPHEFNPDRFLESGMEKLDVSQGRDFWFAPFGTGRRSCPGSELALQVMHLTVARLVQGFELSTPTGEPTDMGEGLGITMPKALPLEVMLKPRLSTRMYA